MLRRHSKFWPWVTRDQALFLDRLGFGWIPELPIWLGHGGDDPGNIMTSMGPWDTESDPDILIPIANHQMRLGIATSMHPLGPLECSALRTRHWKIVHVTDIQMDAWARSVRAYVDEFVLATAPGQMKHSLYFKYMGW